MSDFDLMEPETTEDLKLEAAPQPTGETRPEAGWPRSGSRAYGAAGKPGPFGIHKRPQPEQAVGGCVTCVTGGRGLLTIYGSDPTFALMSVLRSKSNGLVTPGGPAAARWWGMSGKA